MSGKRARIRDQVDAPLLQPVPGPRPYPIIGNLRDLGRPETFFESAGSLLRTYGPYVRVHMPGGIRLHFTHDADIVADLLARPDDFQKIVSGMRNPLYDLRRTVGSGLFTADDTEDIWHVAHRIVQPAMGRHALTQYFPQMVEVTDDLLERLEAFGGDKLLATEWTTRATFETIAYTGFGTRFDAVRSDPLPPFVQAMVDVLVNAMGMATTLLPPAFHPLASRKRKHGDAILRDTVDGIIAARRAALERGDPVPNDMLQAMLTTRDRVTGQRLPDENIRHQLVTLLIAGHETTSGALSYALYYLCRNRDVEAAVFDEVDRVLGRDTSYHPTSRDVEQLDLVGRVLKETLRLSPTAPVFSRVATRDTVVDGRYPIATGDKVLVILEKLQTNPEYWGPDPLRFDPDRFLPANVAARHPHAYHPFGMGMRACIGSQFALLEAKLILARIYQRFVPRLDDPHYVLRHVPTLTIKPAELWLRLERRPDDPSRRPASESAPVETPRPTPVSAGDLLVLYGSNMGASTELATRIAREGEARGSRAVVAELDAFAGGLPESGTLLVVCSTYNGHPPDNAAAFARSLPTMEARPGLRFAVLGSGNSQWRNSYQAFPKQVHDGLIALGASPLVDLGASDADGDTEGAADAWIRRLWEALPGGVDAVVDDRRYEVQPAVDVPAVHPLGDAVLGRVKANLELQAPGSARSTRHLEITLPDGLSYVAGDHLGVFPENPPEVVEALARRCDHAPGDVVIVTSPGPTPLPTGIPVTVGELLARHVDLLGPVTRQELRGWARAAPCPPDRQALEALAAGVVGEETTLGLLERFPSVTCDLGLLLSLRPPIKPRHYSIPSSPRALVGGCAITVGVAGLCSRYLAALEPGATVRLSLADTGSPFRLPADPQVDVILVGAGTGLAPLRGFLQERAAIRREGLPVGRSWLFFGCRDADCDYLYREELEGYLADGTLAGLYPAFSRRAGTPRTYVQDRIREHATDVVAAIDAGAWVMVCGDARRLAGDVAQGFVDAAIRSGRTPEDAASWRDRLVADGRYLEDVWAS